MALPWFDIQAAETKVNAADGQTLNDKYRQNHDKMGSIVSGDGHSHDASANGEGPIIQPAGMASPVFFFGVGGDGGGAAYDIVLNSLINWRDRYITVVGKLIFNITEASNIVDIPGGADDDTIGSGYTDGASQAVFDDTPRWMYTQVGGAVRTDNPNIQDNSGIAIVFIWVDSTTGALKLGVNTQGVGQRWQAYNLIVFYSGVQGAV